MSESFTPEWRMLIACARADSAAELLDAAVHGPLKWPALLAQADEHSLLPLLAFRLHDFAPGFVPPEIHSKLHKWRRSQALSTLALSAELCRILERFADLDIRVLVTKGPALAVRCYGDPSMRQYGDLDLVVRDADMRRTTQAMVDLGYHARIPLTAIEAKKMPGEYAFRKSSTEVLVEFHTEQTFRYHPRRLQIEKLFDRHAFVIIDGRNVPTLSLEDELVLICVHGAKHFWERLMWIADVAALISRQALAWDRAVAVASEVGAVRILHLGLRLASDVLGAKLPAQVNAAVSSDRVAAKLSAQIKSRLASREPHEIGIAQRVIFRVKMRGNSLQGIAYLLRLSLSPTEEDWTPGKEGNRPAFIDVISRPFRLARKHSRGSTK